MSKKTQAKSASKSKAAPASAKAVKAAPAKAAKGKDLKATAKKAAPAVKSAKPAAPVKASKKPLPVKAVKAAEKVPAAVKGKNAPAPAAAKLAKATAPVLPAKKGGKAGASAAAAVQAVPAKGKTAKGAKAAAREAILNARPYDSDGCREIGCETMATTGGYCRLHYIKNWKKIKRKELILKEKKLNQYIEELVAKYPDKYIEAIRQDLADEKAFAKVIYDLELDENVEDIEIEGENDEDIIENIKRDFEDGDPEF